MYKWYIKREAIKDYLWVRSLYKSGKKPTNIYYATIQKTGSQWVKSIFRDARIKKITGLEVFPQYRYEEGQFKRRFPRHTFVAGLYIPPMLYHQIKKPENYRTFYIKRDPRDVVVSWYYSTRDVHPLMGNIGMHRKILKELNFEDGIEYAIKQLSLKFTYMRQWHYLAKNDTRVEIFKFEELTSNPVETYYRIFEHCNIPIDKALLAEILEDYTKNKMRKRDLKDKKDKKSHYRKKNSSWQEAFNDQHIELFKNINGDLLKLLDYEEF